MSAGIIDLCDSQEDNAVFSEDDEIEVIGVLCLI